MTLRVQTTAFVTIPQTAANASGPYTHHLFPSVETIDEAIYASYSGGNEDQVAKILRTSPAAQFQFVWEVKFERFIMPPTPLPSVSPSSSPTDRPSHEPSVSPTYSPSDRPSALPTPIPSSSPSLSPTVKHSDVPSEVPSISPSDVPSTYPSVSPSDRPSSSPSGMPSAVPSPSPSASPSKEATDQPTAHPSDKPTSSPSSSPTHSPSDSPSASPTFYDALVAVEGTVFELSMTPVNTYLYVDAFNELNKVFDDMIMSNLILPDAQVVKSMDISTVMSSQGLKRRGLEEEDDEDVDLLRIDGGSNNGIVSDSGGSDDDGVHRRTRFGSSPTLYVRLQKTLFLSVPSIGEGGQYDPRLIPDTTTIDEATSTVFSDPNQKEHFVQRLRYSTTLSAFSLFR